MCTPMILPGGQIARTTHINYCVSVLSNTTSQLCLPDETGVYRETQNVWQTFGSQVLFSEEHGSNHVETLIKPHSMCGTLQLWYGYL